MSAIRHAGALYEERTLRAAVISIFSQRISPPFAARHGAYKLPSRLLTNRASLMNEKRPAINNVA